jgi:toxin ParE1/3/4
MASIKVRPLARRDIREVSAWLKQESGPNLAIRFIDSVESTLELLASMPDRGSPCFYSQTRLNGLRRWPVKAFERWLIFYFPSKHGIDVARILHGARNLDEIFEESK